MKRKVLLTLTLTAGALCALPAQAQNLTIALEQAWNQSPRSAVSDMRVLEAQARSESAATLLPGAATVSASLLNDQFNANRGRQEMELEVAVPLWLPGQRAARQAEAFGIRSDVRAQHQVLRLQLVAELREAWWAVASARGTVMLATRRVETARALQTDVMRRYKVGELARVDFNLAQGEHLAAQAEQSDAQNVLVQAEQVYRSMTGVAAPAELPAEVAVAQRAVPDDHPLLVAATAGVQLAQARLKLAQESRRDAPSLAMRMVTGRADATESYTNAIGIKLTLPLSFGPRVRQDSATALVELAQSRADLVLAQRKLALDVERADRDEVAARSQLTLVQQRHALSLDTLALAEKSFVLGESDLVNLLRARAAAFDAQAALSRQIIVVSAAVSRINQAMGVLP